MSEPLQKAVNPLDQDAVNAIVKAALVAFAQANTLAELKLAKQHHFGDASAIVLTNRALGSLAKEDKPVAGKILGSARSAIKTALEDRMLVLEAIEAQAKIAAERVDVTAVAPRRPGGARHPLDTLVEEICDFFGSLGWQIADGPQLEHEWFNFDALNFGPDHPARQMQDTFYVAGVENCSLSFENGSEIGAGDTEREPAWQPVENLVLRTHTSPVQAHELLRQGVPLYIACPGKVFRTDALDATHTPVFHQVEGLAVDKGLTMAHLKGVLDHFAKAMFGSEAKTRLRPSFFPFTEPSAEMDLWFPQKKGGPGWIEWGGCGMVNPNVLRNCGIDPEIYSGFAFGMGIERTFMLRHQVADMHDIVEGDMRFSRQFGITGRGN